MDMRVNTANNRSPGILIGMSWAKSSVQLCLKSFGLDAVPLHPYHHRAKHGKGGEILRCQLRIARACTDS
jgi:hypothetical protein